MKERNARGTPIVNLLPLEPTESIQAIVETRTFDPDQYLLFATKSGQVKKTAFSEYDKSRREGFIAINLNEGDELVRVVRTGGDDDLLMVSKNGTAIRFAESEVRPMGRSAAGVRGMRLRAGDEVVSCDVAREGVDLLIVTDAGYGKRTKLDHFNAQTRGGQGVRGIKLTQRRGAVVAALMASLEDEIIVVSSAGVMIRTSVREIAAQGRGRDRGSGHEPRRGPDGGCGGEGPAGDRGRRTPAEVADRVIGSSRSHRGSVVTGQEVSDGAHVELALLQEGRVRRLLEHDLLGPCDTADEHILEGRRRLVVPTGDHQRRDPDLAQPVDDRPVLEGADDVELRGSVRRAVDGRIVRERGEGSRSSRPATGRRRQRCRE